MTKQNGKTHTEVYEAILDNISPELHTFIHEHHQTWGFMKKLRDTNSTEATKDLYCHTLKVIAYEIEHHFKYEEEMILSRLKNYFPQTEVGPIAKLIDEHRSIETKYNEVFQIIKTNSNLEEIEKQIKLLAYLVMKHIEKEDHYFYPMVSQILNNEEKSEILELLRSFK